VSGLVRLIGRVVALHTGLMMATSSVQRALVQGSEVDDVTEVVVVLDDVLEVVLVLEVVVLEVVVEVEVVAVIRS
jgi:hypothetical protein